MKSILFYTLANFFPRLCTFAALFIFSRLLPLGDFGLYTLAIAVGEFCDYTSSTWFRTGFLRTYHPGHIGPEGMNLNPIYLGLARCTAAGVALVWPIAFVLVHGQWLAFGLAASLYVIGNGSVQTVLSTLRGEDRPLPFMLIEVSRPLLTLAAGLIAVWLFKPSFVAAALAVFGVHCGIGLTALVVVWSGRAKGAPFPASMGEVIAYAWPMFFSCILTATMNAADRYQLQWLLGPQAVALYAAAYAVARQPIDIMGNALNLGMFSKLMERHDMAGPEASAAMLARQVALMLSLVLPGVVGLSLLSNDLIHALFDRRFWDAAPHLIPPIAVTAMLAGLKSYGFDQGFYMAKRTGTQVLSLAPAAIIGVGAGAVFIKLFGVAGAAYGMMAGYATGLIVTATVVSRLLPGCLRWKEPAKIALAVAAMAVVLLVLPVPGTSAWLHLAIKVVVGGVVYAAAALALDVLAVRKVARERLPPRAQAMVAALISPRAAPK